MSIHGTVTAFDQSKEDWRSYTERLKHYFVANEVVDNDKKCSILLSVCGPATYRLLRSLAGADKINTEPYKDLVKILQDHYDPNPSPIVQCFKFNSRVRGPDETVAKYVAALRALAEHCFYGDILDDMLRDRLVCGVQQDSIQQRLLAEKDLTYQKALELATAMEAAAQGSQDMKRASGFSHATNQGIHWNSSKDGRKKYSPADSIPRSKQQKGRSSKLTCYHCGGEHQANVCKFIETECFHCKKRGHIAKVCRAKQGSKHSKQTNHLDTVERENSYSLFTVPDKKSPGAMTLELTLNTVPVSMELDTGAALSLINMATYHNIAQSSQLPI